MHLLSPPYPIAFLSDLHLSDRSAGDDFHEKKREPLLWRALDHLFQIGVKTLIFNGDTYDIWEAAPMDIWNSYKGTIIHIHRLFSVVYLEGNHDPIARVREIISWLRLSEDPKPIRFFGSGGLMLTDQGDSNPIAKRFPILVLHGHQFDQKVSRIPKLSSLICMIGGFLERNGFPEIDTAFHRMLKFLGQTGRFSTSESVSSVAFEHMEKNLVPTIICGHTHKLSILNNKNGENLYLNTGSWVGDDDVHSLVISSDNITMYTFREKTPLVLRQQIA